MAKVETRIWLFLAVTVARTQNCRYYQIFAHRLCPYIDLSAWPTATIVQLDHVSFSVSFCSSSCNPLLITLRTLARACFLWVRYDLYLGHIPPHFRPCTLSLTLRVHALGLTVALSTGSNVPVTMDNIADPRSPYWSVLASQQYVCG